MSMGWMTQVASIPEAPPLAKGFTVFHTPLDASVAAAAGWLGGGLTERRKRWWEGGESDAVQSPGWLDR
uniref:Uncharacterized protein n=1 Tax=Oryza brachyantha TaxID=4533 RepID=J3N7Y1_ORYBR